VTPKGLKEWAMKVDYPIVAIGGITIKNIAEVAQTRAVSGIAMISDILENGEISKSRTRALIEVFNNYVK
jgi:thiamine-phosphate pyrophosphorylase/hydroxymethylpyrimidine kinase/phosphomethylpyrimidine kinase/thiamine-phosphate diphosphorylase